MFAPSASATVATRDVVSPTARRLIVSPLRVMDAASCPTETEAVALRDPVVAVIVALPSATAVTTPSKTVAVPSSFDDHVTA
jgi:hypothetical protein